jgi:hypothetical protein
MITINSSAGHFRREPGERGEVRKTGISAFVEVEPIALVVLAS